MTHKIDILFISLQADLDTVGLKSLHDTLLGKSFRSYLLYLPGFKGCDDALLDALDPFIADHSPRIIGISLMSHEYAGAVELTEYLKRRFFSIPVIWGGIHPTVAPEMCLDHADYICVGEGEAATLALIRSITGNDSLKQTHNIWFKENGQIVKNPLSPLIEELDNIPVSRHIPEHGFIAHRGKIRRLDKLLFKKYARWRGTVYSVMGSRGCPFACSYCCNDFFSKLYSRPNTIRRRSVENLISGISRAVKSQPDIRYVNFHDDCFLACTDQYLERFCELYKKHVGIPFVVRCIPAFFTEKKMRLLKTAGVAWISIGLQSGNDQILLSVYNRNSSVNDFLRAAELIRRFNVAVYYDVILDNPFESKDDLLALIPVLAAAPRPYFLQLFSLVFYPGTALYRKMLNDYPERTTEYLSKDYHTYNNSSLNRMVRISGYLPPCIMKHLVAGYRKGPSRLGFRLSLSAAAMVSALILEPLASFRLIRLSRSKNTIETLKILPSFFSVGFSRYVKQFINKNN